VLLQVLLNQEAAPVEALCGYIFDQRTSRLLGQWSKCTARGNTLHIQLAGELHYCLVQYLTVYKPFTTSKAFQLHHHMQVAPLSCCGGF
jgi:hypothetical protein